MKRIILLICLALCVCTLSDARTNPYVAGAIYSDAIAPTVTSCTIAADGTSVTLQFSEPVVTTGYDDNDCDLDCTTGGDNITLDTITGSGSSKAGLTADTTIVSGETCTLDCTSGANEIEDKAGNDYAGDTDKACTNNSTQGGAVYTDCSQINANGNTNSFAWFGDHASGTGYGCKDASTSLNATSATATVNNTSPSSTYSQVNNALFDTANENMTWVITTNDIFNIAEGFVQLDVRMVATTGTNYLFYSGIDGDNKIYIRVDAANTVTSYLFSGGGYMGVTTTDTIADTTWTTIQMKWKNTGGANSKLAVKIGAGSWAESTDTVSTWAGTLSSIALGNSGVDDGFRIDNLFISKTSGY